MIVFRLLGAVWRASAALVLSLALMLGLPSDVRAGDAQVAIVQPSDTMSWRYDPGTLNVSTGTTVNWINQGSMAMTITSPDGLFDSDSLGPGATFSYTFETPGTYRYFCVPYPHMKGVVVVSP